mmetsp:Transcript_5220/g.4894  ORF Transcript_5220/g.4894 Transcript_5220/m.4894 type:complete len:96 (-) Transcript_5220:156-443(-)
MMLNFYTKLLQGSLFHKYREVIMGWKPILFLKGKNTKMEQNDIEKKDGAPIKERVGNALSEESKKKRVSFKQNTKNSDVQNNTGRNYIEVVSSRK